VTRGLKVGERSRLWGSRLNRLAFRCPGCRLEHSVGINPTAGQHWAWNGSLDRPTLSPSLLVTYNGEDAGQDQVDGNRAPPAVCHSFIVDGCIQFLGDCTHDMAGKTVDLPAWPE